MAVEDPLNLIFSFGIDLNGWQRWWLFAIDIVAGSRRQPVNMKDQMSMH